MERNPETPRRFVDLVEPPVGHDWFVDIQNETLNINYLRSNLVWNRQPCSQRIHQIVERRPICSEQDAELCRQFEKDPELIISTTQCSWMEYIVIVLGHYIPHKTAEKICHIIFSADWLREDAVEMFYTAFFPVYLQREYSWQTLHLLFKAYEARPSVFKHLFGQHLIRDVRIQKNVMQDFVVNLKQELRNDFMKALMKVCLTSEEFIHSLPTINLLFLDSEKTSMMCEYVVANLQWHAPDCYTNRDFGRLLLSLMKNMAGTNVCQKTIKDLIDSHGSEFKGPCLGFLDEIVGELVEAQYRMNEQQVVFRPPTYKGHLEDSRPPTVCGR